jgi:hypothetical protein
MFLNFSMFFVFCGYAFCMNNYFGMDCIRTLDITLLNFEQVF